MNILDIIAKKRDKYALTKEEIEYFVKGYTDGDITDYQASALIMAIYINGMNKEEIANLTLAMTHSGEVLDLSLIGRIIVDKHSTGGIGDKVSIALLPVIASLDIPVAKMSGRGLGITGGTVDKLESIPGYDTGLSIDDFIKNVKDIGISLIGQTLNLAPADKKLYALRDTISCVDNIPLIASSIMSKKIASGADKIVLEVTCGKGAFMKNMKEATLLATTMKEIGQLAGKETVCIITNMDEPLGYAIGNSLEIEETIEILKGNIPKDVKEVILEIGSYMVKLAGCGENIDDNKKRIIENINNGKAFNKFVELVEKQGGDTAYIYDPKKFKKADYKIGVIAKKEGYVKEIDAEVIGHISCGLGAGRIRKEDVIDKSVGIVLNKKVGDKVLVGETLGVVHANDEQKAKDALVKLEEAFLLANEPVEKLQCILDII